MTMNRQDIKSIQSDISELIFYAKNTSSGNVSHKMPSIMCRLNEIDTKLKDILFVEYDDRTQEEKDIQGFIDMSKEKDTLLFNNICTSSGFGNMSKDDVFTIGVTVSKENTNQPYISVSKDDAIYAKNELLAQEEYENERIVHNDIDFANFAKWSLNNLKYYYDSPLNIWYERISFKSLTWKEIFNIYKDEKNVG